MAAPRLSCKQQPLPQVQAAEARTFLPPWRKVSACASIDISHTSRLFLPVALRTLKADRRHSRLTISAAKPQPSGATSTYRPAIWCKYSGQTRSRCSRKSRNPWCRFRPPCSLVLCNKSGLTFSWPFHADDFGNAPNRVNLKAVTIDRNFIASDRETDVPATS